MADPVRVRLLGGFSVSIGDRSVGEHAWSLRKARSLVKLLALAPGRRLHREQAMETLWPDAGRAAAANNLRRTLHAARRALSTDPALGSRLLVSSSDQVILWPEGRVWVDAEAFEEAAREARWSKEPLAYEAALDLYAGELLPEDRYEEWAQASRERLRGLYLSLLLELAQAHEARREPRAAIEALQRAVAADPLAEEAHIGLMRLHALSGRKGEALRQYERLRGTLERELGTEPGLAARCLRQEIVANRIRPSHLPSVSVPENGRPAREASAAGTHNLPARPNNLVGRERELVEVKRELAMTRLLTLTGTGGTGKTRLALEVARELAPAYQHGAWIVQLAGLSEPGLVPDEVARALGVREQPGRSLIDALVDAVHDKEMLLVLDNCEHLVDACAGLSRTLLSACLRLRILATSREPLGVPGETDWVVVPLPVPELQQPTAVEDLVRYASARLFVERARRRNPAFALTPDNAGAVAQICQRLDGIPLAIELAAARMDVLAAAQVADRLDRALGLLTSGSRAPESRHQTLRAALDWSYQLLSESERKLFRRLSVFAGGFSLEAAEAVGAGDGIDESAALELFLMLVDKSLVEARPMGDGWVRYRMLEPVRQYARERLEGSVEAEAVRRRHAAWFLALAEEAEPELAGGPNQRAWLRRLESEHDNLRAALSWALARGEAELGLRLGGALGRFWYYRGNLSEGRRWLGAALASDAGPPSLARVKALAWAHTIAWGQSDFELAAALGEEGLELSRKLDYKPGIARALANQGMLALFRMEFERASALLGEAVALSRELGDTAGLSRWLPILGLVALSQHDYGRAMELHEESLVLVRKTGDETGTTVSLTLGAFAALGQRDYRLARDLGAKLLDLREQPGMQQSIASGLHVAAALAGSQGQPVRSARLWGAAEALYEAIGMARTPVERYHYGPYIEAARAQLDEAAWEEAWAEGRAMAPEEAVEYASSREKRTATPAPLPKKPPVTTQPDALTPREREVAELIAQGLTNRRIASELSISERTVTTHVGRIFKKLDLRSREHVASVLERRPHTTVSD